MNMLQPTRRHSRGGFTIVEILVAIAIVIVLLGLLLPALGGVWRSGNATKSMNNLRQINIWMQEYSSDNDDYIVPSRFDYASGGTTFKGKVRSATQPQLGTAGSGTWSDILHTVFEVGVYPDAGVPQGNGGLGNDYRYDSPDRALYELLPKSAIKDPFRSAAQNTRGVANASGAAEARPYGTGANEPGEPGYFAANDFFYAGWPVELSNTEATFYSNGQIRAPGRSMYLVDSYAGEIIEPNETSYENIGANPTIEVDFRYGGSGSEGACLMLFLDGHTSLETPWLDLDDLQTSRQIRVQDLTSR